MLAKTAHISTSNTSTRTEVETAIAAYSSEQSQAPEGFLDADQHILNEQIGKYKVLRSLGSGSSGNVLLAQDTKNNSEVAIKVIERKVQSNTEFSGQQPAGTQLDAQGDVRVYREAVISSLISHPNVVRLLDFLYSEKSFFLVFSFVRGEQLYESVVRSGRITEDRARRYFRQIISALEYIHRNCIVHRDLKIENILVDENDNIRIIDFGLSNFYDNKSLLSTFCGSLYFAAPELLMSQRYQGPEIDVWSLGVILYVMLCGKVPFDDESVHSLQNKIKNGKFELGNHLSSEARDLLTKMIVADPGARISLTEIKKSTWTNMGYSYGVHNYMLSRKPVEKLDMMAVRVLSAALAFQFPDAENELVNYGDMCSQGFASLDQIYWTRRPVISLYHMLVEEAGSRDKKVHSLLENLRISSDVSSLEFPTVVHLFVRFVFAGISDDLCVRYFTRRVFDSMSPNITSEAPIIWPCVRKAYIKGFFKGIKARNIASSNALKKTLLDIFANNGISYEADEKSYFCTYSRNGDECYFKISMYFNVLMSEYFFILTCLNSRKELFKVLYSMINDIFSAKRSHERISKKRKDH